ncbi:MAG: transposase [Saprospiraceae bacterium]|nr:transposase [Saprospiraceae bacterium]
MSKRPGYNITDQFASHYMTFTAVGWVDIFTRKQCKDIIIDSMKYCQKNKGLVVQAYVIMPSHLHVIWKAEEGSIGLSAIIRDFKKHTSKSLISWVLNNKKESRRHWMKLVFKYHAKYNKNNINYQVWKRGNRPKLLLYPNFIYQKLFYIHNNPVVQV